MLGTRWKAALAGIVPGAVHSLVRQRPEWVLLCGQPGCRRFTCTASWLRRDGIELHGRWLCSKGCLVDSLLSALREAPRGQAFPVPPRLPYRLALLRLGVLSETDLQRALGVAADSETSLACVLLASGAVSGDQLAAARAMEYGCAHYRLTTCEIEEKFRLPPAVGERFEAVAVHGSADRWLIGFVERVDRKLLALAEKVVGIRPEGCVITAARRAEQLTLDKCRAMEISVESPAAAVAYLAQSALQNGAERLRVGLVEEDLVWACFSGIRSGALSLVLRVDVQSAGQKRSIPARQQMKNGKSRNGFMEKEQVGSRTMAASCR